MFPLQKLAIGITYIVFVALITQNTILQVKIYN